MTVECVLSRKQLAAEAVEKDLVAKREPIDHSKYALIGGSWCDEETGLVVELKKGEKPTEKQHPVWSPLPEGRKRP